MKLPDQNAIKAKWLSGLFIVLIFLFKLPGGCKKAINAEQDSEKETKSLAHFEKEMAAARIAAGNIQVQFPQNDPGGPYYVMASPILNQLFVVDGWLVMPFYRNPNCVREDFNLLEAFDVPAAFSCPLTVTGSYIIEADAPIGTFPIIAQSTGSSVPFWFVKWKEFEEVAADGVVTIGEIRSLQPLEGAASKFKETLRPRIENHLVQINASGLLSDGRTFSFHITHVGDQTKNIDLTIK